MSEILEQENAVVLAAAEKMVSLGQDISERVVDGKQSKDKYEKGVQILRLLTAYKNNTYSDDDLESVLYCLRDLSEESLFPTVSPIVGQELVYLVESESGVGSGSVTVQNNGSTLTVRDTINFYSGLFASDDGTKINVGLGGNLSVAASIGMGAYNLTIDASGAGDFALNLGSDATGDFHYRNSSGKMARLALGSVGTLLGVAAAGTLPSYLGVTSPLSVSGSNLTIQVATGAQNGYLSSADWTTFNNKASALGYTPINKAGDTGISGTLAFLTTFGIDGGAVLPIGANATTVNIGGELQLKDKLITLGYLGGVGSGDAAGFEIMENGSVTGYFKTTAARNGFAVKPPSISNITNLIFSATATRNITFQDGTGTVAFLSDITGGNPFSDATALVMNDADNSKLAIFSAASISPATTRTYTLPNASGTLALTSDIPASSTYWTTATGGTASGTNTFVMGAFPFIMTTGVTTGTGATAGHQLAGNSLTTGNLFDVSSTSVSSGALGVFTSTSTVINHTAGTNGLVEVLMSGANSTASKTAIGIYSKVTNTGTTNTNIAGYFEASGATTNIGLLVGSGFLGVNTATTRYPLDVFVTGNNSINFRNNTSDGGIFIIPTGTGAGFVGAGVNYENSSVVYRAKHTSASLNFMNTGTFTWYGDTGLTPGNTYTPTQRMNLTALGNLNIGTTSTNLARLYAGQSALSSAWIPAQRIDPGAHTSLTSATAFPNQVFASATQSWVATAGTIAAQKDTEFRAITHSAATSGTFTDLYNVFMEAPLVGGAATATNAWALGLGGGLRVDASNTTNNAFDVSSSSISTGALGRFTSTSTAIDHTIGTHGLLRLTASGAMASTKTAIGVSSIITTTGTASTNIAGYFLASGASTNYAIQTSGQILLKSPIADGDTYNTSGDAMVEIQRTTDNTLATNAHSFGDSTIFQRSTNGWANNAFNDYGKIIGTSNYDHHASYQNGFSYQSSGTLGNLYGFYDAPVVTAGTITNRYGVIINDITGAGAVTNNYGIYISTLTKGGTLNYGIYCAPLAVFGNIQLTAVTSTFTADVASTLKGIVTVGTVADQKMTLYPDQSASGELRAGAWVGNQAGGAITLLSSGGANATASANIAYYDGSGFRSALEVDNVASGFSNLKLMKSGGNIGIGTSTFGTSAAKNIALGDGTAPSTDPTSALYMWSSAEPEGSNLKVRTSAGHFAKPTLQKKVTVAGGATLRAIGSAPQTIIAAPGANKYINIISVAVSYNYGAAVYDFAAGEIPIFKITGSGTGWMLGTGIINTAADANRTLFVDNTLIDWGVDAPTNTAFVLTTKDAGDATTGDGDLDVVVYYTIEDANT